MASEGPCTSGYKESVGGAVVAITEVVVYLWSAFTSMCATVFAVMVECTGEYFSWVLPRAGVDDGQFVFMLCRGTGAALADRRSVSHCPALTGIELVGEMLLSVVMCTTFTKRRSGNCCYACSA